MTFDIIFIFIGILAYAESRPSPGMASNVVAGVFVRRTKNRESPSMCERKCVALWGTCARQYLKGQGNKNSLATSWCGQAAHPTPYISTAAHF
jgi:hypothetical protein